MAYACVSLATLSLQTTNGTVGTTVTGTGKGFSGMMGAVSTNVPAQPAPVEIHFGARSGPVVWTGLPDGAGQIAFSFQVPASEPGQVVVFATQYTPTGAAVSGTPARATFTVDAPPAAPAPTQAAVVEPEPAVAAPAPAAAPVAAPAPAPRVRVATNAPAATPAAAPAPAPAAATATPEIATPSAPVADTIAAPTPARRSVMVSMATESDDSPALAIALVGVGLVLALGASALVLAGRRESKVPAGARRS